MQRLNTDLLSQLPAGVTAPSYDRSTTGIGIVHIGPGAFHRSHQAHFTERALTHGGDWGICGVSLNSTSVKDALSPQDGLYTLAIQEQDTQYHVVGALMELLQLEQDRNAVMSRLLNPDTKVVTLTITEKGYCLDSKGNLDQNNSSIQKDLANPETPMSAIGLLAQAAKLRHAEGQSPWLVISCDNVTENGRKLKRALVQFAEALGDTELVNHIENALHFPCTMVDSITPATDDTLRDTIERELGYSDAWPIKREAFAQWVIESTPVTDLPAWEKAGVTFTDDVEGFENAKLRLLNLPHSCLAYMGRLLELETVYEAINHTGLASFVRAIVDLEVIPSCAATKGLVLEDYRDQILQRFHNPSIKHLLEQIAHDGSQKLQMRLIPVIESNLQHNRPIDRLCMLLAAWLQFIVRKSKRGETLVDPMSAELLALADQSRDSDELVERFLAVDELFSPALVGNARFQSSFREAYQSVSEHGIESTLEKYTS